MKFTEKQRKQIRRIIESIYLNVCQDSMIDEIQSVLSSLPAPTQDGTAEDGTAEEFMDQWSNHNSWRSKGGIHKMITAYAAPLRAEIERHRSLDEICIHYSKDDMKRQKKEMVELGLWNAPVFEHDINLLIMVVRERGDELTRLQSELAASNQRIKELEGRLNLFNVEDKDKNDRHDFFKRITKGAGPRD